MSNDFASLATLYNLTPTESVPVSDMSCEDILKTDIAQIGYTKSFDEKCGRVVLIGGRDCWTEITQAVADADEYLRTKLQKMEDRGYDMESMGLPNYEEYVEMVDKIPDYSDGVMLLTGWKWRQEDVQPGQAVGLCLEQGDSYASCWSFNK